MSDPTQAPSEEPERFRYVPEWETPTRSPKRSSLWDRLAIPAAGASTATRDGPVPTEKPSGADNGLSSAPSPPTIPANEAATPSYPFSARLRARFDAVLPHDRTYYGHSRRWFLLAVVLPAVLFLSLVLPLALGLGLGLGLRHGTGVTDLPLPGTGAIYTGDLTYFDLGLGACGWTNTDTQLVCAVAHTVFDAAGGGASDPNTNPLCGRTIRVERDETETGAGNVSVDVTVVDRCVGCAPTDLDLSPAAFDRVALASEGRVVGSWAWLD